MDKQAFTGQWQDDADLLLRTHALMKDLQTVGLGPWEKRLFFVWVWLVLPVLYFTGAAVLVGLLTLGLGGNQQDALGFGIVGGLILLVADVFVHTRFAESQQRGVVEARNWRKISFSFDATGYTQNDGIEHLHLDWRGVFDVRDDGVVVLLLTDGASRYLPLACLPGGALDQIRAWHAQAWADTTPKHAQ